jgi:hypothetical protein
MRQWVKWHTKVLTEPKVLRLNDKQFRVFANVIALAGYLDDEEGRLGPTEDVALHLRLSVTKTGAALTELCAAGIVILRENVWFLKNWNEYNGKPTSDRKENVLERVHKHRGKEVKTDPRNAVTESLQSDRNAPRVEKNREEEIREKEDDGADAPPPPESVSESALEKSAEPLTSGQRLILGAFGAKRFKTNIQREAVLALEKQYGTTRLKECIEWAAKRGMGLGEAIGAIEKAIPKWGQPKPANGRHAAPATQPLSSDEVAKLNADLNKNRKGFQPAQ